MKIVSSAYHKLINISPKAEVLLRSFYWNNVGLFKKFKPSSYIESSNGDIDFDKIKLCLTENGVKESDILIIHSAFSPFKKQFKAEFIVEQLLSTVPNGTIAMPAIRQYDEELGYDDYIYRKYDGVKSVYDVHNSKITSGYLPYVMTKDSRAHISRCPLNPLVAIGREAEEMMKGNIDGEFITAHGLGSTWWYCVENDAWNIGLGIKLEGFLTIFHYIQENGEWPISDWFFEREFGIVDGMFKKDIVVNERKHLWTKYYAETNFNNDMIKAGVVKIFDVDGIPILMTKTSELISFLYEKMKTNPTYPYYIPKKYIK